ncbi:hypothetical protein V2I52_09230 [Brenneria sp. g21c3]|uniref:hypothetical protein n=1 Tax=Brenneria sp. g21c3 TaxID=3093893 RepID=UPI002EC073A4|nr:hypothetical protein [Brenneria sp. g21c3]
MKKLKKIAVVIPIAIIGFMLIDCSMQKVAERHEGYIHSNLWAYYLYTDREIRNAPKLSENYHFTFTAQDGSQPQDSSIVYGSGANITALRDYLSSLEYVSVKREGLTERWQRAEKLTPYYLISRDPERGTLTLTRSSFN